MLLEVHSEFNWKCLVFDINYYMDFIDYVQLHIM